MKKMVLLLFCMVALVTGNAAAADGDDVGFNGAPPDLLSDEDYLQEDLSSQEVLLDIYDPLEPLNRAFFQFNDKLYFWVLKPVKTGYSYVVPAELRECIGNFFNNLAAPIRMVNNVLQGRFEDGGVEALRFVINSTFGVYGLADVALREYNLEPKLADFGQTLGVYGLGEGVYIHWPVLGPSSLRHSFGLAGDALLSPVVYIDMTTGQSALYYSVNRINFLSLSPDVYEDIKRYSLDPYVATRQSFYDFRKNMVTRAKNEETDF